MPISAAECVDCPELLTAESPQGLRVRRLTSRHDLASSHIYMESPVFTPDSRRFVFQRLAWPQPVRGMEQRLRQYWLCDLANDGALHCLAAESMPMAPAVSPDGRYLYYFTNHLDPASRRGVELRRVCLDSFMTETVMVLDQPVGGLPAPPSRIYSLATIRADGQAVCTGAYFGDGHAPGVFGVLVCDLARREARVIHASPNVFNPHPQYARHPDFQHDLLIQENIGAEVAPNGAIANLRSGCTLFLMRDDGTCRRDLPATDGPLDRCHGHQEWRGSLPSVITGVDRVLPDGRRDRPVIEVTPDGARDLTAAIPLPMFAHTAFDATGTRFIADWLAFDDAPTDGRLFLGTLETSPGSLPRYRYLLHPRTHWINDQLTHPHPFLSPDCTRAFFNSTHSGIPQIYAIEGLEFP